MTIRASFTGPVISTRRRRMSAGERGDAPPAGGGGVVHALGEVARVPRRLALGAGGE